MGKLTALIEAAKAAKAWNYFDDQESNGEKVFEMFHNHANPTAILELCALLEKAEEALKCVKVYIPPSFANTHNECNETLAAIKQWKEQT